ncbi:Ldh family oxidoreductase [Phyllobacterium myrsinacearum]|uniref:(2R)-3-sulfolactate dehydrogenase (NADP+) n=1 Tax=Phyllobacterium myrsinacearum TaxID=28101 RepID=A0A839ET06_9HYPH|nr:Ldh family oxidoreductase [Phyllobacterium myrsinacearum]MBA8881245.1 (2R)-3-sulfolactate dehydrogenase (NADP+) [Phyllobacterium myrsinacearum]
MTDMRTLTFDEIESLATKALVASNVASENAKSVAQSIAVAERDGQAIVGLSYLPTYCDHAACGKVDGHAVPRLERQAPAVVHIDAGTGFAHPAIALGLQPLAEAVRECGIAALSVGNSYACGSLGYFVEELATRGFVALMVANASPSIAPFGGKTPFFGTNPLAFGVPRQGRAPLVIDQSSSVVAKVAVIDAYNRGVALPDGWAIDANGMPTNDAVAAMEGSLLPIGGYKGFGLALMVDILAAGLTRSHWSFEASSFGDCEGGPPRTGQMIIALDPALFGGDHFSTRLEEMFGAAQETPGVRLPGDRRIEARKKHTAGIEIPAAVVSTVERYARQGSPMSPK